MRVNAFDPDEDAVEAIDVGITALQFLLAYYEPFVTAINRSERREQTRQMTIAYVDGTGVRVGLDNRILRLVRMATQGETQGLADEIPGLTAPARGLDDDAEFGQVFPDGTLIGTSWDEAIQVRDGATG